MGHSNEMLAEDIILFMCVSPNVDNIHEYTSHSNKAIVEGIMLFQSLIHQM